MDETIRSNSLKREEVWTESIAVGGEAFISETKRRLASKGIGREVQEKDGVYELREPTLPYRAHFYPKKDILRPEHTYFWDTKIGISIC